MLLQLQECFYKFYSYQLFVSPNKLYKDSLSFCSCIDKLKIRFFYCFFFGFVVKALVKETVVLLYILLYNAFSGFLRNPDPFGIRGIIFLLSEVLAAMLFFSEGVRKPNFILFVLPVKANLMTWNKCC